jgi:hypothetical protein
VLFGPNLGLKWCCFQLCVARRRLKCIFGAFMMGCSIAGSGPRFRAIPKNCWGGPRAPRGPLTHSSASRRTLHRPLCTCGGHRQPRGTAVKKEPKSKMSGADVFSGSYLPMGQRDSFIQRVYPQLVIPPCRRSSSLE